MNFRLKQFQERIALKTLIYKDCKNSRTDNTFIEKPLKSESVNALIESIDYCVRI